METRTYAASVVGCNHHVNRPGRRVSDLAAEEAAYMELTGPTYNQLSGILAPPGELGNEILNHRQNPRNEINVCKFLGYDQTDLSDAWQQRYIDIDVHHMQDFLQPCQCVIHHRHCRQWLVR